MDYSKLPIAEDLTDVNTLLFTEDTLLNKASWLEYSYIVKKEPIVTIHRSEQTGRYILLMPLEMRNANGVNELYPILTVNDGKVSLQDIMTAVYERTKNNPKFKDLKFGLICETQKILLDISH